VKSKRTRQKTRRVPRHSASSGEVNGTNPSAEKPGFDWARILPFVIVVAAFGAYAGSFAGVFVFDDTVHIVQNERIRDLANLENVLSGKRPIVDSTLAINYSLGGLEPWGYHAVNLGIHVLAALALYGVISRTLRLDGIRRRLGVTSSWVPFCTALIWAVHPLQTQSITYVIQRAESLMGMFYILTLYCIVRAVQSPRSAVWHAAAVGSCALGMGCKAVMVTAPVVVLLFDLVFVGPSFRETIRRRWALYLGLAATWGVLWLTDTAPGVLDPSRKGATVGFGYQDIKPIEYGLTQFGVLVHYLRLSFWPYPLCLDYDWPVARSAGQIVPYALVIGTLVAGTIWALVRKHWLGFLGAWFFLILAPTSTVVPIKDTLFEHRMYLPLAAVVTLVVIAVDAALRRLVSSTTSRRVAATVIVTTVTVVLGAATFARNRVYHSAESLWRNVAETRPDNARAFENLGTVLMVERRIEEAIPEYRQAVALDPDFVSARNNLANALSQTQRYEEAIEHYAEVLRVDPFHPEAHINRAHAFDRLGQTDAAIEAYRAAARLDPTKATPAFLARARTNLASVLANQGDLDSAIDEYREAVRLRPDYDVAHYWWGVVLYRQGKLDEAIERFRTVLEISPEHEAARRAMNQARVERQRARPD